jgi:hypothetical protein
MTAAMSGSNSVLTCVPVEIWRMILLEVIHIPYLLDTNCTIGSFFILCHYLSSVYIYQGWSNSERQRNRLRLVCKSWRHFAETQGPYRHIESGDWTRSKEAHIIAHARGVKIDMCSWRSSFTITMPTLWEVVEIYEDQVDEFLYSMVQGYHPRLRRLDMQIRPPSFFAVCESTVFDQLTFLRLNFKFEPSIKPTPVIQTILPRLEALIWEGYIAPTSIFRLPTLQYFGWNSFGEDITTSDLLSYAPTLRSLSIRGPCGLVILPDLNEFPHLEELSVLARFKIQDLKPFPPIYPLHTIYVNELWSNTRHSLMQILDRNPVKLRRIHSCELEWKSVRKSPEKDRVGVVDVEEEDCLADACEERGIRFEDLCGLVRSEV